MADQSDRTRCAAPALVIRAVGDAFHVAVHPEQTLPVSERDQRAPVDRVAGRFSLGAALPVAFDPNAPPAYVLDDLHEVDRFA
jgi:hypothetical protein